MAPPPDAAYVTLWEDSGGLAGLWDDCFMAKPTRTPAGNYRVIVDFGGQRKSATFPTLKAARTGQARMLVELGSKPMALTATIEAIVADHIKSDANL